SLRYFYTGVTEPTEGQPTFVAVGEVDGELVFVHYDSETQRMELRVPWELGTVDSQYWDRNTRNFQGAQQVFHVNL
ncbi:1A26 protein, partial [Crypturellus undulatus]|nr:1A26 protein [Crypturellus undulatus]